MAIKKKKSKSKLKGKRKVKIKRHTPTTIQDEKLCLTKGQLMNVVIAAEVEGYKDARRNKIPKKCCPKAKEFVKALKTEMRRNK